MFAVTGLVNHAGSRAWSPPAATEDAEVVRRLRAAGAVVLGTHHLYEFAMGGTAANPHFGTLPNPWDSDRIPGGSGSGSAVTVAAGLATAALGTDANGSIREPAAFCGITGQKPTLDWSPGGAAWRCRHPPSTSGRWPARRLTRLRRWKLSPDGIPPTLTASRRRRGTSARRSGREYGAEPSESRTTSFSTTWPPT